MAESPSHRFGQIVGNLLEEILLPELESFVASRNDLYLDRHGERTEVRKGKKVSWDDKYGNQHDLDFVIEKNGSALTRGRPVAFVEAAWRRYTKHSRNKAQEIQGAVLPTAEKYQWDAPFLGAVLAGVFTSPSLAQLESNGFEVVYLPYESIVSAFASVGIDARFDEKTPRKTFSRCVNLIGRLPDAKLAAVRQLIVRSNRAAFDVFFQKLHKKLDRLVERVLILPLFGTQHAFASATSAAGFIETFDGRTLTGEFQKFDVHVEFSNGDRVSGLFSEREDALNFLGYVTG